MSKYLIEESEHPPERFHYVTVRPPLDTPEQRTSAEDQLKRHGCTKIIHIRPAHYANDAVNGLYSYGIVEPQDIVRQRVMMPRYD